MDEKESWGLTEDEIKHRLRQQNQENSKRGFTRGGRSSGQGVKLLYIRDYLYAEATKEHPKKAKEIQSFFDQRIHWPLDIQMFGNAVDMTAICGDGDFR